MYACVQNPNWWIFWNCHRRKVEPTLNQISSQIQAVIQKFLTENPHLHNINVQGAQFTIQHTNYLKNQNQGLVPVLFLLSTSFVADSQNSQKPDCSKSQQELTEWKRNQVQQQLMNSWPSSCWEKVFYKTVPIAQILWAKFEQLVQLLWTYLTEWTQVSLGICNTLGKDYAPIAQMLMRCWQRAHWFLSAFGMS